MFIYKAKVDNVMFTNQLSFRLIQSNSIRFYSMQFLNNVVFLCLQVVSDAAGQGVTITGSKTFNNWNWPNAVIFAATVITTIGTCDLS